MAKKPQIVDKRMAYESRKFYVYEQDLVFPDGHKETWEYIQLKGSGGSAVLALTEDKQLILVNEYRGAAERYIIRIPTGLIEEGEDPAQAARRELQEEAGYHADKVELIEEQGSSSSYYKSQLYLYFASGLKKAEMRRDPGERDMEILHVPVEKAYEMVNNLEIDSPQTIYAILRLKKYLRETGNTAL